jgi:outer membrane protein
MSGFQSGGALKTDLLSLQVSMAETEEILVQSRNRQRLAKAALAEILGVEPDMPFGLAEATPSAIDVPDDPFSALDYAIANRPELASVSGKNCAGQKWPWMRPGPATCPRWIS